MSCCYRRLVAAGLQLLQPLLLLLLPPTARLRLRLLLLPPRCGCGCCCCSWCGPLNLSKFNLSNVEDPVVSCYYKKMVSTYLFRC